MDVLASEEEIAACAAVNLVSSKFMLAKKHDNFTPVGILKPFSDVTVSTEVVFLSSEYAMDDVRRAM